MVALEVLPAVTAELMFLGVIESAGRLARCCGPRPSVPLRTAGRAAAALTVLVVMLVAGAASASAAPSGRPGADIVAALALAVGCPVAARRARTHPSRHPAPDDPRDVSAPLVPGRGPDRAVVPPRGARTGTAVAERATVHPPHADAASAAFRDPGSRSMPPAASVPSPPRTLPVRVRELVTCWPEARLRWYGAASTAFALAYLLAW